MKPFQDKNYIDRVLEFTIADVSVYMWILLLCAVALILILIIDIIEEIIKVRRKYNR